jgi:hypothetical protein
MPSTNGWTMVNLAAGGRRSGRQQPPQIDGADENQAPRADKRQPFVKELAETNRQRNDDHGVAEGEIDAVHRAGPDSGEAVDRRQVIGVGAVAHAERHPEQRRRSHHGPGS